MQYTTDKKEIVGDVKAIFTEKNWSIESKEIKLKEDFGELGFLKTYLIAKSFTFQLDFFGSVSPRGPILLMALSQGFGPVGQNTKRKIEVLFPPSNI